MKKLTVNLLVFMAIALAAWFVLPGGVAYAACPDEGTAEDQVLQGVGQTGDECDDSGVTSFVGAVVRILSYVAGIAAIIMILFSGFRYITSAGDSNKVGQAKSALIYALVGVAVAALAQVLVAFVFNEAETASTPCPTGQHRSSTTGNCVND